MSVTTQSKALSAKRRSTLATQQLRETLRLDDGTLLVTAILEAAAEWIQWDKDFRKKVNSTYSELTDLASVQAKPAPKASKRSFVPVLVGNIDPSRISAYGPLDPYLLFDAYGASQLRDTLNTYSIAKLREGVAAVEEKNPNTRPANRSRKDSLVDYIVEHIAGPGY